VGEPAHHGGPNTSRDTVGEFAHPTDCQKFAVKAGQSFRWTSADEKGAVHQNGAVQADRDGLVTIPKLTVTKAKRRIIIGP